jgi:predicted DNA-binding transcriptional regulator YafY
MRADRLLSILLLLQMHRLMTARDLAQRLEVSERTIHRDMEALGAAGIPVYAERGARGGWGLLEGYQTHLTGLQPNEIRTLFLTGPARVLSDLGLRQAGGAALIKLLAALPVTHRRDAEQVRQRIHVDVAGWHPSEENLASLPTLQAAIWQERKLLLTYQRDEDSAVERLVDPLGLVAKGSVWYLVAAVETEMRTYRVSRIRSATVTEHPCTRPPAFDLATYWEESKNRFVTRLPRYPVLVRAEAGILSQMRHAGRYSRVERVDPGDVDGWSRVALRFETEDDACAFILGFGPRIEVEEPAELRAKVRDLAEGVVALYGKQPPTRSMSPSG